MGQIKPTPPTVWLRRYSKLGGSSENVCVGQRQDLSRISERRPAKMQFREEDDRTRKWLERLIQSSRLTNPEVKITEACKPGDNHVGVVHRVELRDTTSGQVRRIRYILKSLPSKKAQWQLACIDKMFQREIYFYKDILPTLENLTREHGRVVQRIPRLYDCADAPGEEFLLLEDLSMKGYTMKDSKMMDYPHLSLALKSLAQFHAYSFAIRAQRPKDFAELSQIKEPLFCPSLEFEARDSPRLKMLCSVITEILKEEGGCYSERFDRFADGFYRNMMDATDGHAAEPYAVLNHGDAWTNNLLFSYRQEPEERQAVADEQRKPYDLYFLDFQLCRYASPVLDIAYMLFCCSTLKTRHTYLEKLLCEYYDALAECLTGFDCDPETLFPRRVLAEHFKRFGKFAAGMAVYVTHLFMDVEDQEEAVMPHRDVEKLENRLKTSGLYRERVKEIFRELIDKNYL
ncbi:hypothetical protein KM043_000233 [Ampulex compressa]|nr:hypothetical protein KM043_000233 [Ampulex compressa]